MAKVDATPWMHMEGLVSLCVREDCSTVQLSKQKDAISTKARSNKCEDPSWTTSKDTVDEMTIMLKLYQGGIDYAQSCPHCFERVMYQTLLL